MKVSDFDYNLPDELIADHPPEVRGSSRLLTINRKTGVVSDRLYKDLPQLLRHGDVLVLNDTRVIPARLRVTKQDSGIQRELILIEDHGPTDDWFTHTVLHRGRLSAGNILLTEKGDTLTVDSVIGGGLAVVSSKRNLLEIAEETGTVPLPPYMHREATPQDTERYQTVWAREKGSVAAPTASLNMTRNILKKLADNGVEIHYLTLHVGLGTFLPIRTDDVESHDIHREYFHIPPSTAHAVRSAKQQKRRVIAVGTTVTRTLEYAIDAIMKGTPDTIAGEADIYIYPGYTFKAIDGLVTNFHAPRSTVLMLTAAFAGWPHLKDAYAYAVKERYNFLSYGDSMFIS